MTQKYIDELDEVLEKVSIEKENAELKLKGVE